MPTEDKYDFVILTLCIFSVSYTHLDVKEPGLYKIKYNTSVSPICRIDNDVYARGVWQPVLEYFLPVQMCHMRVNEKRCV